MDVISINLLRFLTVFKIIDISYSTYNNSSKKDATLNYRCFRAVAVQDFKNGGGGLVWANQNNVRTFFLLLINVIFHNI